MSSQVSGLDRLYEALLRRRAEHGRLRRLSTPLPSVVDFSSNDYLSISTNRDIRLAYLARLQSSQTEFSLGSGGSRLLDGNSAGAEELERRIARFHGASSGLLFNSGFDANVGLFSCATQPGDAVVHDELIHASVHDGLKLGRARAVPFAHNLVSRSTASFEGTQCLDSVLQTLTEGDDAQCFRSGERSVFIAVESVYSMDGDVAPLQEIVACVKQRLPSGNGYVVVDEAHATGWMGEGGRGLVSKLNLESQIWARVHTFGKALSCSGAIILCSSLTRDYLINYARSLIYTTSIGWPTLASIQTAYDFLESKDLGRHVFDLSRLIEYAHGLLVAVCRRQRPLEAIFLISEKAPSTPIIPLFTSHARQLAQFCQDMGFMIRPIVAPTVPKGTDRVRLCLHARNTRQEVQALCGRIEEWIAERYYEKAPQQVQGGLMPSKL